MKRSLTALLFLAAAGTANAQVSIAWSTIDCGGGTSTGPGLIVTGTIGQWDAGEEFGPTIRLTGGFWGGQAAPPTPPCDPDMNLDGNADSDDVVYIVNVIAGGPNPAGTDPDFNRDGNVDMDDYITLVNVIAGGSCP